MADAPDSYSTPETIVYRRYLEHIRLRPGMYIGDTGQRGLHYLVRELFDNAVNEARAGFCRHIEVTLLDDGGCRVSDDGRGISVDLVGDRRVLEIVLSDFETGYQLPTLPGKVAGGLSRVGLLAVNALSEQLLVQVQRDGTLWEQTWARGAPTSPLRAVRRAETTGTTITFWPDPLIFGEATALSFVTLRRRLRQLASFTPGLVIRLRDERTPTPLTETMLAPEGLPALLGEATAGLRPVHASVIHGQVRTDLGWAAVAFRWCHCLEEQTHSYANTAPTHLGGPHVSGLRTGVTRAVRRFLRTWPGMLAGQALADGDAIRTGLVAVVAVDLPEPIFSGATRERIQNPEAEGLVSALTRRCLDAFLRDHADEAEAIARHILDPRAVDPKSGELA